MRACIAMSLMGTVIRSSHVRFIADKDGLATSTDIS